MRRRRRSVPWRCASTVGVVEGMLGAGASVVVIGVAELVGAPVTGGSGDKTDDGPPVPAAKTLSRGPVFQLIAPSPEHVASAVKTYRRPTPSVWSHGTH